MLHMTYSTEIKYESPASAAEACEIQSDLRGLARLEDDFPIPKTFAGVDVGYNTRNDICRASVVVVDVATLEPVHQARAELPTPFPFIPGLLSFREIPVLLKVLELLPAVPDLIMVDGQGIAHPRRMGIATHLGILLDIPTIGVAKGRLTGSYDEPAPTKGSYTPLMDGMERLGSVLRSRDNTKPLFVSPGHRVSVETSVQLVQHCLTKYRLPEPTRLADKLSKFKKHET